MSVLIPMTVSSITVPVAYSLNSTSFDIKYLINNGLGPFVHSITQPPSGFGTLARDPNLWDRYQYTKPTYKTGTFTSTLTVTDANNETATAIITFALNLAPAVFSFIDGPSLLLPVPGSAFSQTFNAFYVTYPLTWSLVSGSLPSGLSLSQVGNAGVISGTTTEFGDFNCVIHAVDSSSTPQTVQKVLFITVSAAIEIKAPAIPDVWDKGGYYEFLFTALLDASNPYNLTWTSSGLPAGMTLTPTGPIVALLSGRPTTTGSYSSASITVRNTANNTEDSVALSFSVVAQTGDLTASNDVVSTAYETPITIDVLANDNASGATIVGVSVPNSGTVVVSSGKIVYTPQSQYSGTDSFVYTLSDGTNSAQGTVTITVGQPGLADAPLITNAPSGDIAVQQGDAYSLTLTATGGVPPYRWGISSSSSAINWLTVNPTTGALAGTFNNPAAAPGYTDTFLVTVTDTAIPPKSDTATISFVLGEPVYTATIQGTLRLDTSTGAFAARKVYLYNYTTGAKVAETTSNGTTGAWEFTAVAPGEYFVVGVAQGDDLNIPRDFDAMGVITVV